MHKGEFIFSQIMDTVPRKIFNRIVEEYHGDDYIKEFSCRDQFLAMAFAQITNRSGLRGIESTLNVNQQLLYHLGFRCDKISRNTLAHANENRPWQIYAELATVLMERARKLYINESLSVDLDTDIFALDSTTIELCLTRFPWTPLHHNKAAVKARVLLNLHGNIPEIFVISRGKYHDVNIMDELEYQYEV